MADIFLKNTLSGEKETFIPLKAGEVSIYNCGPTVYDYAHIGNFRTFIMSDILRRMFEYNNYKVKSVMNITDVDDKTIRKSQEEGVSLKELTQKYEALFFQDLSKLNIQPVHKNPRATESISEMIDLISTMIGNGSAYIGSDGVYFDIKKSENYGKLANLNLETIAKERITNDEYDKANPRDFSLWKFYTENDGGVVYDAPFGKGRPGWHIECSAMCMTNLGKTIDIHTGGSDLIFPHHTNEIAQSEAVTGQKFVNYWVHAGFITVDGKKMSKSLGNIFTLKSLQERDIDPIVYRYFVLGAHYSTPLNFTWEALSGAETALKKVRNVKNELNKLVENDDSSNNSKSLSETAIEYKNKFLEYVNNDLDTPKALALIWQIVKDDNLSGLEKRHLLWNFDKVLGLDLDKIETFSIPENVIDLVKEREKARTEKNFTESDRLRDEIMKLGFVLKDTENGTEIEPQ